MAGIRQQVSEEKFQVNANKDLHVLRCSACGSCCHPRKSKGLFCLARNFSPIPHVQCSGLTPVFSSLYMVFTWTSPSSPDPMDQTCLYCALYKKSPRAQGLRVGILDQGTGFGRGRRVGFGYWMFLFFQSSLQRAPHQPMGGQAFLLDPLFSYAGSFQTTRSSLHSHHCLLSR